MTVLADSTYIDMNRNTWQQIMLFILIIMGSAIFVSSAILHIRKRAFENRLEELAAKRTHYIKSMTNKFSRSRRRSSAGQNDHDAAIASGAVRGRAIEDHNIAAEQSRKDISPSLSHNEMTRRRSLNLDTAIESEDGAHDTNSHIRFKNPISPDRGSNAPGFKLRKYHSRVMSGSGVGAHRMEAHPRYARPLPFGLSDSTAVYDEEKHPSPSGAPSTIDKYLKTINGYIGRNSQFHNLSEAERRKLGGIEYDAVCLLSWLVPTYFVLLQLFGAIGVGAWMTVNNPSVSRTNGLNPFWTGAFFSISAFNNSGMALLDANAVAIQTSAYCLLTLSFLSLAGNTAFPPFLRLTLWSMKKLCPSDSQSLTWQNRRCIITFILDHPRRVYTNLFPAQQTWWLVTTLVILNGTDWIAFEVLNIGNPVTNAIPPHYRVLDGLFQAFAVRSGGFYVVSISSLRSGLLVLYVLMMYVSALPVTMSIRNTNVYEERSLGIFAEDNSDGAKPQDQGKTGFFPGLRRAMTINQSSRPHKAWDRQDFLRQQLRGQLGHDLWWIALAVLFITIIETGQFERDPVVFATFNIIFEGTSPIRPIPTPLQNSALTSYQWYQHTAAWAYPQASHGTHTPSVGRGTRAAS
jgi:potassium uptake Trk family protein